MRKIIKKTWPSWFDKDRDMRFDIRLADFDLNSGDQIVFKEWDPETKQFTGREYTKTVEEVAKCSSPLNWWSAEEIEKHGLWMISFSD